MDVGSPGTSSGRTYTLGLLYSHHIQTLPSGFSTGTIGVAHSLDSMFSRFTSCTIHSSVSSTLARRAHGIGLGLQNFGVASASNLKTVSIFIKYKKILDGSLLLL